MKPLLLALLLPIILCSSSLATDEKTIEAKDAAKHAPVVATVNGSEIYHARTDLLPGFPKPNAEKIEFNEIKWLLIQHFAKAHNIEVTDKEVDAQWQQTSKGITEADVEKLRSKLILLFKALRANLNSPADGEKIYSSELASSMPRKEWELWKATNKSIEHIQKQEQYIPANLEAMKKESTQGIVKRLLIEKATSYVEADANNPSTPIETKYNVWLDEQMHEQNVSYASKQPIWRVSG